MLVGGQSQGLNMGMPFGRLYQASLAEDAYASQMAQDAINSLQGLGSQGNAIMRSGGPLSSLESLYGLAGGIQAPQVGPSGVPDTIAEFQQGIDLNRMLAEAVQSQDPALWEQLMPFLLPLLGVAVGGPLGGMAGASLGLGIGSAAGQGFNAMRGY